MSLLSWARTRRAHTTSPPCLAIPAYGEFLKQQAEELERENKEDEKDLFFPEPSFCALTSYARPPTSLSAAAGAAAGSSTSVPEGLFHSHPDACKYSRALLFHLPEIGIRFKCMIGLVHTILAAGIMFINICGHVAVGPAQLKGKVIRLPAYVYLFSFWESFDGVTEKTKVNFVVAVRFRCVCFQSRFPPLNILSFVVFFFLSFLRTQPPGTVAPADAPVSSLLIPLSVGAVQDLAELGAGTQQVETNNNSAVWIFFSSFSGFPFLFSFGLIWVGELAGLVPNKCVHMEIIRQP